MKQSNFSRKKNVPINCLLGSAQVRVSLSDYKSGLSPVLANCSTPFCMFQQGCRLVAAGSKREAVCPEPSCGLQLNCKKLYAASRPYDWCSPSSNLCTLLVAIYQGLYSFMFVMPWKPVTFRGGKGHSI